MKGQEVFQLVGDALLNEAAPSIWLKEQQEQPWFRTTPFSMLREEIDTPQSPVHHPEGSVWNHTLMVVDEAAKRKQFSPEPKAFMWAALLHDLGKPATTRMRKGRITAYDHDKKGAELAKRFLQALTQDQAFVRHVVILVRYHMQILYVAKNLPFQEIEAMRRHADVEEVALLCYCDRLGRLGAEPELEREQVRTFLERCGASRAVTWL